MKLYHGIVFSIFAKTVLNTKKYEEKSKKEIHFCRFVES